MKILILLLLPLFVFAQVNLPTVPQPSQISSYSNQNYSNPSNQNILLNSTNQYFDTDKQKQQKQHQQIIGEVEQYEKLQAETLSQINQDINEINYNNQFDLPSLANKKGTEYYRNTFDKMLKLNIENYSIKNVNFDIENAYLENREDKAEFDKIVKQSGEFIIAKMKELKYDTNSNSAKNFMLFEFFSETLQLKSNGLKHFPIKYDFDDFWGKKDWSKMFVTKLLKTQTGQCHSMPLLYLTLAEEIGAEAYLSLSPNHSYIKFQDENEKWYNLELTNGMLTVSSFIFNSGFIRAEAMQNKIYMQNLSKKELLSQFYVDLASGYLHKFGYDDFVEKAVNKALELYPNNINANMVKANYNNERLIYALTQLKINPKKKEDIERIGNYPEVVELFKIRNKQYQIIDDLGFQEMSIEAYENWLSSLKETKNKLDNDNLKKQVKGLIIKKARN
ncbi:hypothetical protein [Flavobacterium sp.]|uniref:hypothetical protein n=1 Tax=Flavobacterium sp. TaxID=239 RepID=UPI0037537B9D